MQYIKSICCALIILALPVYFFSCNKNKLPAPTQGGANTFGCLINGVPFKGKRCTFFSTSRSATYRTIDNGGSVLIVIRNFDKETKECQSLYIFIDSLSFKGVTKYQLTSGIRDTTMNFSFNDYNSVIFKKGSPLGSPPPPCTNYDEKSDIVDGYVDVTRFDTDEEIISGTFEFTITKAGNSDCEIIEATDGRFDMKFNTLNF